MVCCNSLDDAMYIRALRSHGWMRDIPWKGRTPAWMDPRFTFPFQGYNLRPTEVSAAIGLVQLKKLDAWNLRRRKLAEIVTGKAFSYPPFGLIFFSKKRDRVRTALERVGIETRPVLAGAMWEQPCMKGVPYVVGAVPFARSVASYGFSVGCHPGMTDRDADYLRKNLKKLCVL